MTSRIVSTGSVIVDMTMRVPAMPQPGGDVLATLPTLDVGGGFNLMCAAAAQGASVVYGGRLGTGARADLVMAALATAGIATEYPPGSTPGPADNGTPMDTGLCITFIDDAAERTLVTAPGAEAHLTRPALDGLPVRAGDWVAVSGYDLVYEHSAEPLGTWVSELPASIGTLLDPGPLLLDIDPVLWRGVLAQLDVLTLNDREARLLAPASVSIEALHADIRNRHKLHPDALLVIRHGAAGCSFDGGRDLSTVEVVPSLPVVAVDTTGAGDTHTGVLLAELAAGTPVRASLRRANVAAAISVTRRGPARSPSRAEIDAALTTAPSMPPDIAAAPTARPGGASQDLPAPSSGTPEER